MFLLPLLKHPPVAIHLTPSKILKTPMKAIIWIAPRLFKIVPNSFDSTSHITIQNSTNSQVTIHEQYQLTQNNKNNTSRHYKKKHEQCHSFAALSKFLFTFGGKSIHSQKKQITPPPPRISGIFKGS